ncbi:MAG: DNA-directed RNA polymerase subunit beta' [Acidimicrobiaceae bacterium]|nr:DNA-directed RNA polymerase subunit beta' [Acidimicrobiaceae bacterium]
MFDINDFSSLKIGLAKPDSIRTWSNGEVKNPETINYRTLKPEKDGLLCEKVFGPVRDWECSCGKYKRIRFKGIICERCGVEVARSKVRRERMGHIELASPVVHIWYLRGIRSWLAYLLMGNRTKEELKAKQLESVIYFKANLVVSVDIDRRDADRGQLENEVREELVVLEDARKEDALQRQEDLEKSLDEAEMANAKESELRALQNQAEKDLEAIHERCDLERDSLERAWEEFNNLFSRQIIEDDKLWEEMTYRWGDYFSGGMGAGAILQLLSNLDFDQEEEILRERLKPQPGKRSLSVQRRQKMIKRLRILVAFNRRDEHGRRVNDPRAVILDVVPVLPPDLRPMVQLDGGRFATSDLNDLYRRVINRNNRLKRLLDIGAPAIIVNNERRMLQESVDALFDNGRRSRHVTGAGNRALKSLSDSLKGKQGRFRQNLLGKRVDYSGRSVIVVGPTLRFHQCGLPKLMALELFKPFVMKELVDTERASNIKSAKLMVERQRPQVWEVLEDVISEHPVLLNRAPTLHRLGIQAFEPVLVEGKAIQVHPLVCAAFNADFDGDQMAVHLPLSVEAQAEARILMLSANNILSPAHGRPLVAPTQDMIIGAHYLTTMLDETEDVTHDRLPVFRSIDEIRFAWEKGTLTLHQKIEYRGSPDLRKPVAEEAEEPAEGTKSKSTAKSAESKPKAAKGSQRTRWEWEPTTVGRVFFNDTLPADFGYVNLHVGKKEMSQIVDKLAREYTSRDVSKTLDDVKDICFNYASRSGLTVSIDDVQTPKQKTHILDRYEKQADKIERNFHLGIITDGERRQMEVEIWSEATEEVTNKMKDVLQADPFNAVNMMIGSGARGNIMQVRQIAGMRGLVANPRGDMIPRPIKSNFREGLQVLEYFIATPGARKGLVDTALRTADSGYLTRRLVDVAQEVIVNDTDPFASSQTSGQNVKGIWLEDITSDTANKRTYLDTRLFGRVLADNVQLANGEVILAGTMVGDDELEALRDDPGINRVRVLSPLSDDSPLGISAAAYGMSLATGKLIEQGEAVGVIAAQSIGEPGTQLTMRTFHTGGVAGAQDIAGGLPRVVELFEARTPKGKAILARNAGVVRIVYNEISGDREVTIADNDGTVHDCKIPTGPRLEVNDGDVVEPGDALVEGPRDPKELLEIRGLEYTQRYLVDEVQKVYRDQGVSIHDKHVELIVRQMTRRIVIVEAGDTDFLPDERVDKVLFERTNREIVRAGGEPASGRSEVMGITRASLTTDSWLSAASFQETTRVLTEAAIESKHDQLVGLKENIIIGKLIPAGTGLSRYREGYTIEAPDYKQLDYYVSDEVAQEEMSGTEEVVVG